MKRIVRLTESDLARIVRRVISENTVPRPAVGAIYDQNYTITIRYDETFDTTELTGIKKTNQGNQALKPFKTMASDLKNLHDVFLDRNGLMSNTKINNLVEEKLNELYTKIKEYKAAQPQKP
jgi:hypothetical protein